MKEQRQRRANEMEKRMAVGSAGEERGELQLCALCRGVLGPVWLLGQPRQAKLALPYHGKERILLFWG